MNEENTKPSGKLALLSLALILCIAAAYATYHVSFVKLYNIPFPVLTKDLVSVDIDVSVIGAPTIDEQLLIKRISREKFAGHFYNTEMNSKIASDIFTAVEKHGINVNHVGVHTPEHLLKSTREK